MKFFYRTPAQAGAQTGPIFGGFAASFLKGLGPCLRRGTVSGVGSAIL